MSAACGWRSAGQSAPSWSDDVAGVGGGGFPRRTLCHLDAHPRSWEACLGCRADPRLLAMGMVLPYLSGAGLRPREPGDAAATLPVHWAAARGGAVGQLLGFGNARTPARLVGTAACTRAAGRVDGRSAVVDAASAGFVCFAWDAVDLAGDWAVASACRRGQLADTCLGKQAGLGCREMLQSPTQDRELDEHALGHAVHAAHGLHGTGLRGDRELGDSWRPRAGGGLPGIPMAGLEGVRVCSDHPELRNCLGC